VQTVKAGDFAGSDPLARGENPIECKRPDIAAPKTGKRLPDSIPEQDLRPVFMTSVTRRSKSSRCRQREEVAIAIDKVRLIGRDRALHRRASGACINSRPNQWTVTTLELPG
jgi:inorganic triphosphatase YgiF